MKQAHCPQCGSGRVRRSRRRSVLEHLAGIAGTLTRCHECGVRSVQMAGCVICVDTLEHASRRASMLVLFMAAVLAILAAILLIARIGTAGGEALMLQLAR